jgi:hypothetical protein
MSEKLKRLTTKVEAARRRLEKAGDGRVARMNARKEMLGVLRALRAAVDEDYPIIRKKGKPRRKTPLTDRERVRKLRKRGWVEAVGATVLLRKCRAPMEHVGFKTYVPRWAVVALNKSQAELKRTMKSRTLQRAYNVLYDAGV